MSTIVRVNLLPRDLGDRARARRVAMCAAAAVTVWIALLGSLYGLKLTEVAAREQLRADERAQVAALQAELATLAPFRQLANELQQKNQQLTVAMAPEISWARVMNDVSLAFPANASLRTFSASLQDPAVPTAMPGEVAVGEPVANVEFTGYSVDRFAPGVEAMLLELEGVRSFFNLHLGTAAEAEIGNTPVTNFTGSSLMDDQAFTGRYSSGLPEEALR